MKEGPTHAGTASSTSHPDEQVDSLEQEIRAGGSAEEIGHRLSTIQGTSRRGMFAILKTLAQRFGDQPEIVHGLVAGCRAQWESTSYILAKEFLAAGKQELARQLYEDAQDHAPRDTSDPIMLYEMTTTGLQFGDDENVDASREKLLSLLNQGLPIAFDKGCALTYTYVEAGRPQEACDLWKRLLSANPHNERVRSAYSRFLKAHCQSPVFELARRQISAEVTLDPHHATAKELLRTGQTAQVPDLCEKSISACNDRGATFSRWVNLAVDTAQVGYVLTANRIWAVILQYAPDQVRAFLRFSRRFNTQKFHPEIDALIRHAHALLHTIKNPTDKQKGGHGSSIPPTTLDVSISIGTTSQTIDRWLAQAGQLVTEGDCAGAFRIWIPLLQYDPRLIPLIARECVRIAQHLSPQQKVSEEMHIEEVLSAAPNTVTLYQSTATSMWKKKPDVARQIFSTLQRLQPQNPGNYAAFAWCLIQRRKFREAAQLWLPLQAGCATSCAICAAELKRQHQHSLATMLFREVAQLSPETLLRIGYEHCLDPHLGKSILEYIMPILPKGGEITLERHQLLALRLFSRHCVQPEQVRDLVEQLVESRALSRCQAQKLLKNTTTARTREVQQMRDEEIERYLEQRIPDLRGGKFFKEISERRPELTKPGDRTDRTARAVVNDPERLSNTPTHGPTPWSRRRR
ncbi:hypothetical protein COU80_01375 [Candidatus Peregrinibacteria bacterium CG10_big_fil_rev_8_21_14_0_10_55_24]|nr:MAG: hypothetical protein COU80_01375 [Candidatus Peregrinibacteria bacterium CG10_big_fil_rev_8_21_14_0_10_55_24]